MFEKAMIINNVSTEKRITYKTLITAGIVAIAVILPQLVHLALGAPGGVQWLPMYFPVLIGGCLLGARWGLVIGLFSPLASFLITSAMGNPMPMAERLPYMMIELAVFAVVSGLFHKKIAENGLWAFLAVFLAQVTGRIVFLGLIALTPSITQFTVPMIWAQIKQGFIGLFVQALLVPILVIGLKRLIIKKKEND